MKGSMHHLRERRQRGTGNAYYGGAMDGQSDLSRGNRGPFFTLDQLSQVWGRPQRARRVAVYVGCVRGIMSFIWLVYGHSS